MILELEAKDSQFAQEVSLHRRCRFCWLSSLPWRNGVMKVRSENREEGYNLCLSGCCNAIPGLVGEN